MEKFFEKAGKSETEVVNLMNTIDFVKALKETVFNKGDKIYRFERFNAAPGVDKHFYIYAYGADAGPTSVGFRDPFGYKLVEYEVTAPTKFMESKIKYTNTTQYFSTELQNNIKKIKEE